MSGFSTILNTSGECKTVRTAIEKGRLPMGALGLALTPKAHLIHTLCAELGRRALVVLPDEAAAAKLIADLETFGTPALLYPARDFNFRRAEVQSREFEHKRLGVLHSIVTGQYCVIACSAEAAMQLTLPASELQKRSLKLKVSGEHALEHVISILLLAGYVRAEQVEGSGQFASRGGILDFFPPSEKEPVRVEFWGDSVDSISYFDPMTQRRTNTLDEIGIIPATEILFDSDRALAEKIEELASSVKGRGAQKAKEVLFADLQLLREGVRLSSLDKFLPIAYEGTASIFDYCAKDLLFVCESSGVKERANASQTLMNEEIKALFEDGTLCKGLDRYALTFSELTARYESLGAVYLDNFARGSFDTPVRDLTTFNAQQTPPWDGSLSVLLDDIRPAIGRGMGVVVFAGTEKAAGTFCEDLAGEGISSIYYPEVPSVFSKTSVSILSGALSAGVEYPQEKVLIITYNRHISAAKKAPRKHYKATESFHSLEELQKGDYVVHSIHGIGIFDGIQKMDVGGVAKDYIKIKYAASDALYVPVTQLDLVSKYIGPHNEGAKPLKLNKLGSKDWEKSKARVRGAVKDMADELIALYAKRMNTPGFAFSQDIDMQHDFENRFEFDETDDQLRCVYEIKGDMEKSYPMDRLLCGDVGFGKTEVALRAAFKCVADGKQCAFLVPTTILALQHYQTLLKRFEGFPIESEMISRFRTPQQQARILRGVKRGNIDIIVGTHRLISKDVQFKDLGLVIVDEEQRFGVAQKERLKEMFPGVDILTLSATPIPRTLNMAMTGIRDMSVIEEAPQDRYPVQTYVMEHDMSILAEAISKELRRGGQVYYLHNRVETIDRAVADIKRFLPDARIGVGHGKMAEEDLSNVWRMLLEGEIDILVCTTIIETGVDVPNANTLIIENADRMGLAQLHQIRGRVGRSTRRAYAYFTIERGKALTEIAESRLSAIREYTEFGSGFKIAMRDLEIRGAGNLLGAQQHGHMESVGYDMYLKLLAEAVNEQKGDAPAVPQKECLIDIQIDAHIPDKYITSIPQRLSIYRRIADVRTEADAQDVLDELIDRFGEPPESVRGLIQVSLLRNLAAGQDIYEIGQRGENLLLYFTALDKAKLAYLAAKMRGRILVSATAKQYISVKKLPKQSTLDTLREALLFMADAPQPQAAAQKDA
ncbi:MAG: transcription-repair coupling factor [Oscillospiraceae bacterium]|jgi:transcription-repair coupling factor (superfamily II helicase)|nr:transcription-repair coupling factor [Oscillospiraceae bacterium]